MPILQAGDNVACVGLAAPETLDVIGSQPIMVARGFNLFDYPTKLLISTKSFRQLSGWYLSPLDFAPAWRTE